MTILCTLFGHAWRERRVWSRPGDATAILETVITGHSGAIFAAMAVARGMRSRHGGYVCHRCDTPKPRQNDKG